MAPKPKESQQPTGIQTRARTRIPETTPSIESNGKALRPTMADKDAAVKEHKQKQAQQRKEAEARGDAVREGRNAVTKLKRMNVSVDAPGRTLASIKTPAKAKLFAVPAFSASSPLTPVPENVSPLRPAPASDGASASTNLDLAQHSVAQDTTPTPTTNPVATSNIPPASREDGNAIQSGDKGASVQMRVVEVDHNRKELPNRPPTIIKVHAKSIQFVQGVANCRLSEILPKAAKYHSPLKDRNMKLWRLDNPEGPALPLGPAYHVAETEEGRQSLAENEDLDVHELVRETDGAHLGSRFSGVTILVEDTTYTARYRRLLSTFESTQTAPKTPEQPVRAEEPGATIDKTARSSPSIQTISPFTLHNTGRVDRDVDGAVDISPTFPLTPVQRQSLRDPEPSPQLPSPSDISSHTSRPGSPSPLSKLQSSGLPSPSPAPRTQGRRLPSPSPSPAPRAQGRRIISPSVSPSASPRPEPADKADPTPKPARRVASRPHLQDRQRLAEDSHNIPKKSRRAKANIPPIAEIIDYLAQEFRFILGLAPDEPLPGELDCKYARDALDRQRDCEMVLEYVEQEWKGTIPEDAPNDLVGIYITREHVYQTLKFSRGAWNNNRNQWNIDYWDQKTRTGLKGAATLIAWARDPDAKDPKTGASKYARLNKLPFHQLKSVVEADREGCYSLTDGIVRHNSPPQPRHSRKRGRREGSLPRAGPSRSRREGSLPRAGPSRSRASSISSDHLDDPRPSRRARMSEDRDDYDDYDNPRYHQDSYRRDHYGHRR